MCTHKRNYRSKLIYTLDGGKSWNKFIINNNDTAFNQNDIGYICFYDSIHGTAISDGVSIFGGCREIWNTNDGGISWERLPCDSIDLFEGGKNMYLLILVAIFGDKVYNYPQNYKKIRNNTFMVVGYNYGRKWEIRETNIPYTSNRYLGPAISFRDSLFGISTFTSKFM